VHDALVVQLRREARLVEEHLHDARVLGESGWRILTTISFSKPPMPPWRAM